MNIHKYNVANLLVRMLDNTTISRQEIIDFILKCEFVSAEKVDEFLQEVNSNYPLFDNNEATFIESEDPELEELLPLDHYDN